MTNPLVPPADHKPEPEDALPERLARAIALAGPIPVAQFMAAANAHYYGTRDPLGAGGDFTTSPEISQMFGELVGLWCADLWDRAGRPEVHWVELGPGRGTLAADARRAMAKAGLTPTTHFVETSATLRSAQGERVPDAEWHDSVDTLPTDRPERLVAAQDLLFLPIAGPPVPSEIIPEPLREAEAGSVIEVSPASVAVMRQLAARIAAQGGAALIIDYGYEGPAIADTLQAVRGHAFANPFDRPGEQDLSAHVDFTTLAAAAQGSGLAAFGPVTQRDLLGALGIDQRTASLARAHPDRADALLADRNRLMQDMGTLFRALAITRPDWPAPAGYGE